MFPFIARKILLTSSKKYIHPFDISKRYMKVCVLGAAGGIGTNLCLLLKQSPLVTHLNMYDIVPHLPGVAMDLSHIESNCHVCAFCGKQCLPEALTGMQILVFTCGFFRDTSMVRDDLFDKNAEIIVDICEVAAVKCPNAIIMIVTNPVNSLVPLVAEFMKKHGVYDCRKIMGITTLDVIRANTFVAETICLDPRKVVCPVIGGHSTHSIIPVLSHCTPKLDLPDPCIEHLIDKVQQAGVDVVTKKAIDGKGSATLAMAYAGARFITAVALAKLGQKCIVECTYAPTCAFEGLEYFSTPCLLGIHGIEKSLGVPKLSKIEQKWLEKGVEELKANIEKGAKFDFSKKKGGDKCGKEEGKPKK